LVSGFFLGWNRIGLGGIWLRSGFCESSISSLVSILPCFEHSMHTVSLAPSISALIGLVWIFRPQTSHRTDVHRVVFIMLVMFIVVES